MSTTPNVNVTSNPFTQYHCAPHRVLYRHPTRQPPPYTLPLHPVLSTSSSPPWISRSGRTTETQWMAVTGDTVDKSL